MPTRADTPAPRCPSDLAGHGCFMLGEHQASREDAPDARVCPPRISGSDMVTNADIGDPLRASAR